MTVADLAQGGREEPLAEGPFGGVLEALGVLQDLAAHRLHEVRARLLGTHDVPGVETDEAAHGGQVPVEQLFQGGPVAVGESLEEREGIVVGHRAAPSREHPRGYDGGALAAPGQGIGSNCAATRASSPEAISSSRLR